MDALRNNINALTDDKQLDVSSAFAPLAHGSGLPQEDFWMEALYQGLSKPDAKTAAGLEKNNKLILANKADKPTSPLGIMLADKFPPSAFGAFPVTITPTGATGNKLTFAQVATLASRLKTVMNQRRVYASNEMLGETIHILSLFMEIEDTSRNKYNYTMSENDRAFALYMIQEVFKILHGVTPGSLGEVRQPATDAANANVMNILRGYRDTIPTTTGVELQRRADYEILVSDIEAGAELRLRGIPANDAQRIQRTKDQYIADWRSYQDLVQEQWRVSRLQTAIDTIIRWSP